MHITKRMPRETGRDYALRTLKDNIIRLELEPGSMVSENELSAQMGLSRTPVREALMELSKVGVVEIYPQRGSAIALVDYAMVEQARFMRNVLEQAVVELCCRMADAKDILGLEESLRLYDLYEKQGDQDTLLEIDNDFHRKLFRAAGKEQVHDLIRGFSIHFDRVRRMSLSAVTESKVLGDHTAIVEAVKARDPAAAKAAMEKHLTRYRIDETAIREKYPGYFKE